MLQAIHVKRGTPQACSLYCRWIRVDGPRGPRLVAVWIDSEMRAFARDFGANHGEESESELVSETRKAEGE